MQKRKLTLRCGVCSGKQSMFVDPVDLMIWESGTPIQTAMPYLTADEREMLISHTCGWCFEDLFSEEDEEVSHA